MNLPKFIFFFFCFSSIGFSQNYLNYSNDSLEINSNYFQEKIKLNLHVPETLNFSSGTTTYPITIIFDSQHERTYPQIINAIDLLTGESQMPETLIVGIPFDRNNRYYRTSNKKLKNDSIAGIEKMEKFLFKELIPSLQEKYKANDFITLIGHSRTAFLVNYLTLKQSKNIDVSVALSGFYSNKPLSIEIFKNHIADQRNFPNKIQYYFAAGNTLEEETYFTENKELANYISKNRTANFRGHFIETRNANHMTNYWLSVPPILMEVYKEYNSILNNWFYKKLKNDTVENPVEQFKLDLQKISKQLGFDINPSLTHIYSLSSTFGYNKEDIKTAIHFIKLGQKFYPLYADFDLQLVEYYTAQNNSEMVNYHKAEYKRKVLLRKDITETEKETLLKNIR